MSFGANHWKGKTCKFCGKPANMRLWKGYFCRPHGQQIVQAYEEEKRREDNTRSIQEHL